MYPACTRNRSIDKGGDKVKIETIKYTPTKVRIIWPAVMFAASRNDSVTGRKIILVVSISTKKGFSQAGAPPGSSDAAAVEGE